MKLKVFSLFVVLTSCTTFKYAMNERIVAKEACMPININGLPMVEIEVDHKRQAFVFDTGSMGSVVFDSTTIENFKDKKFGTFGSNAGADRKTKKNRFFTAQSSAPLFESQNKLFIYRPFPESKCSGKLSFKGILGLDAFFEDHTALVLNFTQNQICNIAISEISEKLKSNPGYQLLKSQCVDNQVFICLFIEGKEYKFKLDTGYTDNFVMPYSVKLNFKDSNRMQLYGMIHKTISSETIGEEVFYEKMPMRFAGTDFEGKVNVSSTIKTQNMGWSFIKAYDWIIDYKNNKVYAKRNQYKIQNAFNRVISYFAKLDTDDKLIVSTRESHQTKFNIGDEITTVNGEAVTAENNCRMQNLLNTTPDWNTLNIEVIPISR